MFTNILVPLEGSKCSEQALELAISVARAEEATITLLHAVDPTAASIAEIDPSGTALAPWLNAICEAGHSLLHAAEARVKSEGLPVRAIFEQGNPVEEILWAADREGCDLIVMGCHGRRGLVRAVMGSVSEAVVRAAHVPVMIAHATNTARVHVVA